MATTVTYSIVSTADDVTRVGTSTIEPAIYAGNSGSNFYAGLRFLNVDVPQGASVTAAPLRLVDNSSSTTGGVGGKIYAVDAATAPAWSVTTPDLAPRTDAFEVIVSGAVQVYDMADALNEVFARPDWVAGGNIAFVTDPTGTTGIMSWVDYGTSPSQAAQLSITYESGGPDVTPPTITSSATPSVVEGSALSHALTANEAVTWAIVGGADAVLFSLAGSTLSLPAQTYPSGSYVVVVRATDAAGNETDQTITVSITEAPPFSFVGAATGTTSATIPAHQAGDLILCWAYRDGSNTLPTLPSGQNWTSLDGVTGANTNSARLVAKIATSSSEATGTFTSATSLIVAVYRPKAGYTLSWGAVAAATAASTTVSYAALSIAAGSGVAAFAGHRSTNTALETPPAGMVLRATVADATDEAAAFDTNGPVSSWGGASVPVGGSSSGWRSVVVEIIAIAAVTARPTFQAFIID